jgi:hypothetical protein
MDNFIKRELLEANCDAVEEVGYTRQFTPEELNERKEDLADTSISISEIENEKKQANDDFKSRLKPLEERKTTLLTELKTKSEFVKEECYKFICHDERMVGYYNSEGELVDKRPIRPQEMQKTIFSQMRTGTDN